MEDKDKIAYEQLLRGIQSYVDKCLAENKEITTTAKVVEIDEDEYTIELNGLISYFTYFSYCTRLKIH